jgi:hypothetical protein
MTRKQAIRAKCIDCSGGNRAEVKRCESEDCPLWPYRLGTHARINSDVKTAAKRRGLEITSQDKYQDTERPMVGQKVVL